MEIAVSTVDWTNGNVTVTIKVQDGIDLTGHVIQYRKASESKWNIYTGAIVADKNDVITARIRNSITGEAKLTASTNITKIDKLSPIGTLAVASKTNTATLTVTANDAEATTEYGCSGIKGYYYSKDGGATYTELVTDASYTFTGLTQNQEYFYKVKIEDNAGNITEASEKGTTGSVEAASSSNVSYTTTWNGTSAVVTFTTTSGFTVETSTDNSNWTTQNPITVPSGTQIYVRLTDTTNSGSSYAAFKPIWTGTISYNVNGGTGSVPASQSAEHNATVTVSFSPLPTRTGYSFQGWATTNNATTAQYTSSGTKTFAMGTSNVTLYAVWRINQYTITYNANGGSACTATTANYGASITMPTPTRTGYTFNGWYTATSGGTRRTYTTMPAGNETVYAQWTINQYTITYNANGGSVSPGSTKANYGASMSMPTPTRSGYTFNGWYTAASGGTRRTYTTMPAYNETVYAQWTCSSHTTTTTRSGNCTNGGCTVTVSCTKCGTIISKNTYTSHNGYTKSQPGCTCSGGTLSCWTGSIYCQYCEQYLSSISTGMDGKPCGG